MSVRILIGDVRAMLATLPDASVDCVVTSPPYWGLRDYGVDGQLGLEPTMAEHIAVMVDLFRDVRRVMKDTATLWLNYGDCYATAPNGRSAADTKLSGNDDRTFRDKPFSTIGAGLKPKDLCMIPNRLAIAMQDDGWWVRSEIIWGKPNAMPDSSGNGRPSVAHEKVFLFAKSDDGDIWRARDTRVLSFAPDLTEKCPLKTYPSRLGPRWLKLGAYYDAKAVEMGRAGDAGDDPDPVRAAGPRIRPGNKIKAPDGWDTAAGAHGSYHRDGREKGKTRSVDPHHSGQINHTGIANTPRGEGRLLRNYEPADLTVWEIAIDPCREAHFATFPAKLAQRCILAGCPAGGVVLDPFFGSGTTGLVAARLNRDCIGIELNPDYAAMADNRIRAALGRVEGPPKSRADLPEMLAMMEAAE